MVRLKQRFLLVEVCWNDGLDRPEVSSFDIFRGIKDEVMRECGDVGAGLLQQFLTVKHWNAESGLAIVRIARRHAPLLSEILAGMRAFHGQAASVRVLHRSGTIKKCQQRAIALSRAAMFSALAAQTR